MKARPAHVLRMSKRLGEAYPQLDFSNITTIDIQQMQTRFDRPDLAGCHISNSTRSDDIYIGLPDDLGWLNPHSGLAFIAKVLLHEVIHREQRRIAPKSKPHGRVFQSLCLKYGLDPRLEIDHDKGQKLRVKVPYAPGAFWSAGGITPFDEGYYELKSDISPELKARCKAIKKASKDASHWTAFLFDARREEYLDHYPAYRLCSEIVKNYHIVRR